MLSSLGNSETASIKKEIKITYKVVLETVCYFVLSVNWILFSNLFFNRLEDFLQSRYFRKASLLWITTVGGQDPT